MGVEKLSTAILEDSKKEAQKITASAQEQADQLLHEENAKFVLLRKSSEESTKELMDAHTNERLAWARLESKRINAEAKEDAISNSLESFLEELNKSKKSKKYKEFVIRSAKTASFPHCLYAVFAERITNFLYFFDFLLLFNSSKNDSNEFEIASSFASAFILLLSSLAHASLSLV